MMCCQQCPLSHAASHPDSLESRYGVALDPIFACPRPLCRAFEADVAASGAMCGGCPNGQTLSLCHHDAFVLTQLPGDSFAQETAHFCLDTLVTIGRGDLLCELFQVAPFDLRQELWDRMVCLHDERRYLLDPLFEQRDTPPAEPLDPWIEDWYPRYEQFPEFLPVGFQPMPALAEAHHAAH